MVHTRKCPYELGRGKPTTEFYINGKPQVYCYGWVDSMTDEAVECCKSCPDWVEGEQMEKDFEAALKQKKMRIAEINYSHILFDNGDEITYDHKQDCCEHNYADFEQIEDVARGYEFHYPLRFEPNEHGFRFGNPERMFFVPCYSDQNGYYTRQVDIYFNGQKVVDVEGEWRDG